MGIPKTEFHLFKDGKGGLRIVVGLEGEDTTSFDIILPTWKTTLSLAVREAYRQFKRGTAALGKSHNAFNPDQVVRELTRVISEYGDLEEPGYAPLLEPDRHLNTLGRNFLKLAREKGFGYPDSFKQHEAIGNHIALIHSEASEMLEALRDGDADEFALEIADVIIRTLALASALGIDVDKAVAEKYAKNKTRPVKHGRRF